jgi:hypothetical protein
MRVCPSVKNVKSPDLDLHKGDRAGIHDNRCSNAISADLENHLHVQALMVPVATTPAQFKLSVEKALGYEKGKRPVRLHICLRQLTGKGIHTVEGIVGFLHPSWEERQ